MMGRHFPITTEPDIARRGHGFAPERMTCSARRSFDRLPSVIAESPMVKCTGHRVLRWPLHAKKNAGMAGVFLALLPRWQAIAIT
jgi:hypothetical protein